VAVFHRCDGHHVRPGLYFRRRFRAQRDGVAAVGGLLKQKIVLAENEIVLKSPDPKMEDGIKVKEKAS
jgi:hypothetical protein